MPKKIIADLSDVDMSTFETDTIQATPEVTPEAKEVTTPEVTVSKTPEQTLAESVIANAEKDTLRRSTPVELVMTDPSDPTEYEVMCETMTILSKEGKNVVLQKDQVITKKDYPAAWVDQAVTNKWLIDRNFRRNRSAEELRAAGYNVHPGAKREEY